MSDTKKDLSKVYDKIQRSFIYVFEKDTKLDSATLMKKINRARKKPQKNGTTG